MKRAYFHIRDCFGWPLFRDIYWFLFSGSLFAVLFRFLVFIALILYAILDYVISHRRGWI
jgi:hypothetical protein